MTREEQIAAARRIAEDNPSDWTTDNFGFLYHRSGPYLRPDTLGRWDVFRAAGFVGSFASPAAAMRALGFRVKDTE